MDHNQAYKSLIQYLNRYAKEKGRIHRIGIEYRGLYRQAVGIRNKLRVMFPKTHISTHVAGSVTAKFFGPELIAITVI